MSGTVAATSLPFREAVAYFRGKTNTPTQHWTDVWRQGHARSFMVAGAATDALLNDFRAEILKALEQGTTLRDFRRGFDDIVARHGWVHNGTPGWRSRIIYETNLSMAYAAGRYAQMTEPDTLAVFPYWQYVHSRAQHPRRQHQAWDGLVLRADDPFWRTNYPPNGWRCGCRVRPLSARGMERMGRAAPDRSPELTYRNWTNPRTGEVSRVPEGIDPGFDYNPGEAWQGPPQIPGDAVTRRPPPGWPPAPPSEATIRPTVRPRRFASVSEADAALTEGMRDWAAALSAEERVALETYKFPLGTRMNAIMRGEVPGDPVTAERMTALREALQRARLPAGVRVFRGVASAEADVFRRAGAGAEVLLPAFVSTTLDIAVANGYVRRGGQVLVELLLPRGLRGAAYVHPFPRPQVPQMELLIAPGARYRVLSVALDRIVVEVLQDGPGRGY